MKRFYPLMMGIVGVALVTLYFYDGTEEYVAPEIVTEIIEVEKEIDPIEDRVEAREDELEEKYAKIQSLEARIDVYDAEIQRLIEEKKNLSAELASFTIGTQ